MLLSVILDLMTSMFGLAKKTKQEIQQKWNETVETEFKQKFEGLCKVIGQRPFLLYYVTIADFNFTYFCEWLDFVCDNVGVENPLKDYPPLIKLRQNVQALGAIKAFENHSSNQKPIFIPSMIKFLQE